MTRTLHKSIDIGVPPEEAYRRWSRFEDFPLFMEGIQHVRAREPKRTHTEWSVDIGGKELIFDALVDERLPNKRIAWHTTGGVTHAGVVTFHRLGDDQCRVILEMDYEPEGFLEFAGDLLGVPGRFVDHNLKNFKRWVEDLQEKRGGARPANLPRAEENGGRPQVSL